MLLPSICQLLEAFKLFGNELNMVTPVSFRQPGILLLDTFRISFSTAHSVDGVVAGAVVGFGGHTTTWIPIVIMLKITALCTFCKFQEALNVGLIEWK